MAWMDTYLEVNLRGDSSHNRRGVLKMFLEQEPIGKVLTDNSTEFHWVLTRNAIQMEAQEACGPSGNGIIERYHCTLWQSWREKRYHQSK